MNNKNLGTKCSSYTDVTKDQSDGKAWNVNRIGTGGDGE